MTHVRSLTLLLVIALLASPATAATIVIVNKDAPGVGFNDPTVAAPIGGNTGATLGEQRLIAFQTAANIWGAKLSSPVTIKIAANFQPLTPCNSGSGVIGSAGPSTFLRNFTNAPRANTWYPVALASALSGVDQAAGQPDGASIEASFNSNIGTAGCLSGVSWYLGLDGNEGFNQIDLVVTLLHEFGHGLGFLSIVDLGDGSFFGASPDPFAFLTFDITASLFWDVMSNAQRLTSMVNNGNVVMTGPNVTPAASILSSGKDGLGRPKLYVPSTLVQGSSVSHFDTTATPNQLMEPSINGDLTHNVDLPNDLATKAMQDLGWPLLSALAAPTGMTAAAQTATSVNISWNAVSGAVGYEVHRSAADDFTSFSAIVCTPVTAISCVDNSAAPGAAYLYKVRATGGGAFSAPDLASAYVFTDSTITANSTSIKAAHFNELRSAAAAVRSLANLGVFPFTDPGTLGVGTPVMRSHLIDLRDAISQARTAMSLSAASFTDGTINAGSSTIRKVHIDDLRNAVK